MIVEGNILKMIRGRMVALRKQFTLLELLVAMAVFSVMMTVLMQYFGSAQKVTSGRVKRVEMFEKARIALEIISRDLQALRFEKDLYRKIYFDSTIAGGDDSIKLAGGDLFSFSGSSISFMSDSQNVPFGSVRPYGHVTYDFAGSELTVSVKDLVESAPGQWSLDPDFVDSAGNSLPGPSNKTVIDGVNSLTFSLKGTSSGLLAFQPTDFATSTDDSKPIFPEVVTIELELEDTINANVETRTFTKMVFLGSRGQ